MTAATEIKAILAIAEEARQIERERILAEAAKPLGVDMPETI